MPSDVPVRLLIVLLGLLHGQASAQTITLLQSLPVFFTCLAQDPAAAKAHIASVPDAAEFQERMTRMSDSPWGVCARRKQWVSKEFCRDLLAASKGPRQETVKVMERYRDEYQRLKPMVDYFEAIGTAAGANPPRVPPPCPD